jgi:xanthine dehydrogenase accessory factor
MDVWQFIQRHLSASNPIMLLCVVSSEGSSPGRRGFKMAVAGNGSMYGSIGGGIMEYKLVTMAKSLLASGETGIQLIHQYHDTEHEAGRSGMICSGSQLNAFVPLSESNRELIEKILFFRDKNKRVSITISQEKIFLSEDASFMWHYEGKTNWSYTEPLFSNPTVHIFGAGHTGLALSEMMHHIGFDVITYDDRPTLNTWEQNTFAKEKHAVDYQNLESISIQPEDFVVVMTIGYRTDKQVLKQLLHRKCRYLGMLGSKNKVEKLFDELKLEGITEEDLKKVFAPVGLDIYSQTTKEIAVSIAAEIIREKNKSLPGGRT